ncbi:MAG: hypothetical protein IKG46_00775 [Solobacterium sp.]|nr:hypothetical protein [Solobacterium sp.]
MTDDLTKLFTDFVEQAERTVTEGSKKIADRIDTEKQKAEIRSEIGHLSRDLSKAYELLGREYYNKKVAGTPFTDEEGLLDRIRSKEKLIDLYNEKLDRLEA